MAVAVIFPGDPNGLGTDIPLIDDLNQVWGLAAGFINLGYALARRYETDRGALFYDLDYGYNLTDLVNAGLTPTDVARHSQGAAAEALKDDRVQTARVGLTLVFETGELTIAVSGTTAQGPFSLVMRASDVTVTLLAVNGLQLAAAAPAATVTQVVQGPPGPPGTSTQGPPGPSGTASVTLNYDPDGYGDSSGAEVVVAQDDVNMGALAASVTLELVAAVLSQSGTATFRVRVGGGDRTVDGSIVATINATAASFVQKNNSSSFTNPNGLQRVKLTVQSSVSGQDAQIDGGATVTVR
jgi:hypothetical protein